MEKGKVHRCVSCGNQFEGRYCNVCSEKILEESERTVFHFILVIFNEITSIDSKLWGSLKTIIFNPGQLSFDYAMGRRKVYMRPITLFFLGNLFYFLFPILDTFNTLLEYQLNMPYTNLANIPERIDQAILASGLEKEVFYLSYNQATTANSKLMLIFLVPLVAPLFVLVGWWQRKIFSEHLMFALELNIFVLYVTTILLGYAMLALQFSLSVVGLPKLVLTDLHLTSVAAVLMLYFLLRGIKQYYNYNWLLSSILAVLVLIGFYVSLAGYRWLLFEVTIAGM